MRILSLFDGMACGMLAMQKAGISVSRYVAYEIDKYAVQTASHNFPMIEQNGDVFEADFTKFEGFDFLIGGSPCTYWSIAQKNNRETEASGMGWELFSQYARALREAKPKFFVYENNKSMAKAIRDSIDNMFGFEAVCINSALVSAQNRQRLYWVGRRNADGTYSKVNVEQPKDLGILLKDILETGETWQDKRYTTRCQGAIPEDTLSKHRHTMVAEPVCHVIPQEVRVRKYSCDIDKLQSCLREHKSITNKKIAEVLGKPVTEVEHWFRTDKCFSIPDAEIWFDLKRLLGIETTEFDDFVTVFETREGVFEKSHRCYDVNGKMSTLMTSCNDNIIEPIRVCCMPSPDGTIKNSQATVDGKSVNLVANGGGEGAKTGLYAIPINTVNNDKSHTVKAQYYKNGTANFVTNNGFDATAVAEPVRAGLYAISCRNMKAKEATKKGYTEIEPMYCVDLTQPNSKTRRGRNMKNKSNCLMTSCQYYQYCGVLAYATPCEWDENGKPIKAISCADGKTYDAYEIKDGKITIKGKRYPIKLVDGFYIIRKLTVKECMRLQTVPEWYEFPVSNSQTYKMLGNGWTVDVIAHILKALKE